MSDEARDEVVQSLLEIATCGKKESSRIAAAKALIAADALNQRDESQENANLVARIIELAAQHGIAFAAGGDCQAIAGTAVASDAAAAASENE
ncbi:MAG: hypothetical protein AAGJ40_02820 [Planctomycetota bacterium]